MKIVVTHSSPDMDAITSVWLIRRFLQGWKDAEVRFVPAGERIGRSSVLGSQLSESSQSVSLSTGKPKTEKPESENRKQKTDNGNPIEIVGKNEVIHVDTGMGPLDHHQTASDQVCGASLTWDFVRRQKTEDRRRRGEDGRQKTEKERDREEAVERMVKVVVDIDHFKEVFRKEALADYHEFDLASILDGIKLQFPNQDDYYVEFISKCLDAVLHEFENRIWAEKEIAENGQKFKTRFGKGIGFETINDSVIKLSQKMGYVIVIRKDPRKGYVRIKALPALRSLRQFKNFSNASVPAAHYRSPRDTVAFGDSSEKFSHAKAPRAKRIMDIDLTLAYERLKKIDPDATWYLHISKKMLLNGSVKNPKMRPTRLELEEIIKVLEKI